MFDFEGIIEDNFRWYREEYPTEGKLTLFLDADYIPYTVGYSSTDEEYTAYLGSQYDIRHKFDHACFLIQDAMKKAGADSVRLFITNSGDNFRKNLATNYKAQRLKEKPPFFDEVREWLATRSAAFFSIRNEADDMISIEANRIYKELDADDVPRNANMYKLWSPIIIGSKDKDLMQVYGWHVDLKDGKHFFVDELGELEPKYKAKKIKVYADLKTVGGKPMTDDEIEAKGLTPDVWKRGVNKGIPKTKRVVVGEDESQTIDKLLGTGLKFFYAQVLMGDSVDNYFGAKGVGASKAYKLLKDCNTEEELLNTTMHMFKIVYGSDWKEELLLNARMAWMQQEVDELWDLPYDKA